MNSSALARTAYARASAIEASPRDVEYRAFSEVTRKLAELADAPPEKFARLAEALHRNQQLWAALASDVADAENGLTDTLRAQIFYLAEFTRTQTGRILRHGGSPGILVEINTSIMKGLRAERTSEVAQ